MPRIMFESEISTECSTLQQCGELAELYARFLDLLAPHGFHGFTLGIAPLKRGKIDSGGAVLASTLPTEFQEAYHSENMASVDPVFDLMASRYVPFTKTSISGEFSDAPHRQRISDLANDHELGEALMIPFNTANCCRGVVLFTKESPATFAKRDLWTQTHVVALAAAVMTRAEELGFGALPSQDKSLSVREIDCLQLAALGRINSEIAQALGVTERTVRFHLGNAYQKLGTTRRSEAIVRAVQEGLIRT